jgi:hypothetical protein
MKITRFHLPKKSRPSFSSWESWERCDLMAGNAEGEENEGCAHVDSVLSVGEWGMWFCRWG